MITTANTITTTTSAVVVILFTEIDVNYLIIMPIGTIITLIMTIIIINASYRHPGRGGTEY